MTFAGEGSRGYNEYCEVILTIGEVLNLKSMTKIRTGLLVFLLAATLLTGPLTETAAASTPHLTFRFTTAGGWQRVSFPSANLPNFRATYARYRVQPGDTLHRLSARFRTTVGAVRALNQLRGDLLLVGQLLLVPLPSSRQPAPPLQPQPVVPPAPPLTTPPQPVPASQPAGTLTQTEQQMLELVNRERAALGLRPLQADSELTRLARMKSQDMINLNYFAHQSPTYGSPFEMMRAAGVTFRLAGENLAGSSTVSRAHTALMNSPGHRANILNSGYTHIGIGAISGGRHGLMITQLFVGR